MKRNIAIALFFYLSMISGISQEVDHNWGIKFSGYVKTDIFYDTRQSSASNGIREGYFYLYPDNILNDAYGNDINANPSFNILSIQTRLKGTISGPDAFGAKTSGVIEAEFFGTSEADINGFRLRHGYFKMEWTKTSLLIGQTWHPVFPTESFPGTISFNTGAPFTPFSRNPQVSLTRMFGKASLALTAYSQRDFSSSGPDGTSSKYLRNSGFPGLDLKLRIPGGDNITGWAGIDYKRLRPELRTSANAETDATIGSIITFLTVKLKSDPLNISLMGVYGQNCSDLVMIGGYAVSGVTDAVRQIKTYTNLETANLWVDLSTNGKKVIFGVFSGFSKNLGSQDEIAGAVYGRGTNIDHLFRISPRASVTEGRLTFAAEIESTTAAYGTQQTDGKVINTQNVSNLRILLSGIYKF